MPALMQEQEWRQHGITMHGADLAACVWPDLHVANLAFAKNEVSWVGAL